MGNKPSLTKQIGEALGTEDKREQLKAIESLLRESNTPTAAITVLFSKGEIDISVSSKFNLGAGDVKSILAGAIDDITEQVVRAKLEQEAMTSPPLENIGPQTGDVMENGDITP